MDETTLGTLGLNNLYGSIRLPAGVNLNYPVASTNYAAQGIFAAPTVANANALSGVNTLGALGSSVLSPELMSAMTESYDLSNQYRSKLLSQMDSPIYQMQPYLQGFGQLMSGIGSLANIYSGFKQLDMMDEQLGMAKEQWATTKQELARIQGVRDKLNASY
jgi:hypothetical protein